MWWVRWYAKECYGSGKNLVLELKQPIMQLGGWYTKGYYGSG